MEHTGDVGFQIHILANLIKRELDNSSEKQTIDRLTGTNGWVIGYLARHKDENVYQKDLENAFSVRRSTISNILALMEKKGLVVRTPSPDDARLKKLELTELSWKIHELATESHRRMESRLIEGLTPEEIKQFIAVCGKMRDNLDKTDEKGSC